MSWQAIKDLAIELFHYLSLGSLYHQDPEMRPIPVENRSPDQHRR